MFHAHAHNMHPHAHPDSGNVAHDPRSSPDGLTDGPGTDQDAKEHAHTTRIICWSFFLKCINVRVNSLKTIQAILKHQKMSRSMPSSSDTMIVIIVSNLVRLGGRTDGATVTWAILNSLTNRGQVGDVHNSRCLRFRLTIVSRHVGEALSTAKALW